ncbi:HNH endonuclease [Sinorhizobium meliloti]|nr:HNH endonuclease [Sinorhizobium meliloti]MQX19777.1 HNH endonuclease [Sinorhizobium meliloti]RVG18542.1 HNH endonuclease [Sinorhizobium meliloti]RVP13376.1 HNH endonuclease [Sinorhizobium meliloti]UFX07408.1 HNH endonuclease [Sinorhizobium meliloti]
MDTRAARYFKWLLFWQQQGRCCYCGEHVVLTYRPYEAVRPYAATLEHLQRRADGGTGHSSNLAMACKRCNNTRGERDWLSYASWRRKEF